MDIAEIEKNANERIKVELTKYKDHDLIGLRVYYRGSLTGQDWQPTKKGITVRVALLPEIIKALQDAENKAQKAGLI